MSLRPSPFIAAALLPFHAWAHAGAVPPVLELRHEALVVHQRITLADVVVVQAVNGQAEQLGAVPLGRAPRVGQMERLSRVQIEHAIRRHVGMPAGLSWQGAAAVVVRTQVQVVAAQQVKDAALTAVTTQFAGNGAILAVDLATPLSDVEVPPGPVTLAARAVPPLREGGRLALWVDLFVNHELYRSVVVQLAVSVRRRAYVALYPLPPGTMALAQDFTVREIDVGPLEVINPAQPLAPFRVARAIRAGQALAAAARVAGGAVLRGDAVRLQSKTGQIGIETAAVALDDALPGQALRVRPAGGRDTVSARLGAAATVILE